ncbi:30S ribosomal protein S6 [Dehalococcoidia bacterium]|nr:30S ribosomal protein S6 [Dehalococcoidia bacterium]
MHDYELVILISPQVADEEMSVIIDQVTSFVTDREGSIAFVKPWGRRKMAYHIGDFEEANYVQANFSMDPQHTGELESNLMISEEVIRHLLLRDEHKSREGKPSESKTETKAKVSSKTTAEGSTETADKTDTETTNEENAETPAKTDTETTNEDNDETPAEADTETTNEDNDETPAEGATKAP